MAIIMIIAFCPEPPHLIFCLLETIEINDRRAFNSMKYNIMYLLHFICYIILQCSSCWKSVIPKLPAKITLWHPPNQIPYNITIVMIIIFTNLSLCHSDEYNNNAVYVSVYIDRALRMYCTWISYMNTRSLGTVAKLSLSRSHTNTLWGNPLVLYIVRYVSAFSLYDWVCTVKGIFMLNDNNNICQYSGFRSLCGAYCVCV